MTFFYTFLLLLVKLHLGRAEDKIVGWTTAYQ